MKNLKTTLILLICICFVGTFTWRNYASGQSPQSPRLKWQYATLVIPTKPHYEPSEETKLNGYGKNGWELVGFTSEARPVSSDKTSRVHVFYFKRPL